MESMESGDFKVSSGWAPIATTEKACCLYGQSYPRLALGARLFFDFRHLLMKSKTEAAANLLFSNNYLNMIEDVSILSDEDMLSSAEWIIVKWKH